jgi:hypothetical protein
MVARAAVPGSVRGRRHYSASAKGASPVRLLRAENTLVDEHTRQRVEHTRLDLRDLGQLRHRRPSVLAKRRDDCHLVGTTGRTLRTGASATTSCAGNGPVPPRPAGTSWSWPPARRCSTTPMTAQPPASCGSPRHPVEVEVGLDVRRGLVTAGRGMPEAYSRGSSAPHSGGLTPPRTPQGRTSVRPQGGAAGARFIIEWAPAARDANGTFQGRCPLRGRYRSMGS